MITYHFISARFNDYFDFDVSIANDIAKCALMQWSPCPEVHALTNGNGRYIMKLNDISFSHIHRVTVYREISLQFYFTPLVFPLSLEGKFITGLIELYVKDYVRKSESGRIQDWVNQSQICIGQK